MTEPRSEDGDGMWVPPGAEPGVPACQAPLWLGSVQRPCAWSGHLSGGQDHLARGGGGHGRAEAAPCSPAAGRGRACVLRTLVHTRSHTHTHHGSLTSPRRSLRFLLRSPPNFPTQCPGAAVTKSTDRAPLGDFNNRSVSSHGPGSHKSKVTVRAGSSREPFLAGRRPASPCVSTSSPL